MKEIGIGLLGFGTVGTGVVKTLLANGDLMAERLGVRPVLKAIADVDLETDRGVAISPSILSPDADAVIENPDVQVIIELVGGTTIARAFVTKALGMGKPVVTANKALLAKYGSEIFSLAAETGTDIRFGASVGGAIPIVRVLREGLIGNKIHSIQGILNGTCNYILTSMEQDGTPFDEALAAAQREGYAEADPTLDVEGMDTGHKATILASLAYGTYVALDDLYVEGITAISATDIAVAAALGYRIKLLAVIRDTGDGVEVRVHPSVVPESNPLATVNGVFNGIMVNTDAADDVLCYGRGAGAVPTSSTILADVADIVRNLICECRCRTPAMPLLAGERSILSIQDVVTAGMVRITCAAGALEPDRLAAAFEAKGVPVESTHVVAGEGGVQHMVAMTAPVADGVAAAALDVLALPHVDVIETSRIRVAL